MKAFQTFSMLTLMVAIGFARGHIEGGGGLVSLPGEGGAFKVCPLPPDEEDGFSRENLITDNAFYCIIATNGTDIRQDIYRSNSPDQLRTLLREYCAMATVAGRCIENLTSIADICLLRPQFNVFKVTRDLLQQVYEVGCIQDGRRLANLLLEVRESFNATQREALAECSRTAENRIVNRSTRDAVLISLQRYRVIKSFKECVVEFGRGESTVVNRVEVMLNEVLNEATCFNQALETVLCLMVDNS